MSDNSPFWRDPIGEMMYDPNLPRETDREIWHDKRWVARRQEYTKYQEWFDGVPLQETVEKRDRTSGSLTKRFPLDLNLVELSCSVHRDLMRGIPAHDDPLAVKAVIKVGQGGDHETARRLEEVINNGVWRASHGGPLQQEAMLNMNIYGGTVFKLSYEPWDADLPYGLAVRLIKSPGNINPTTDWLNPWKMLDCYVGYEISAHDAKLQYGITPKDDRAPVLYMEHWTPTEYRITVDDQVPVMHNPVTGATYLLEGKNTFGFIPIFYVPHERTTKALFGDSLVPRQEDLVKEINARSADLADIIRKTLPGLYFGSDIDQNLPVYRVTLDGKEIGRVVSIGRSRPSQAGGGRPNVIAAPMPDIPESLIGFPQTLLDYWMMMARISPAVFGLDDTSSGRVTGPAIGQRMWTSIAYAVTGRTNFSDAKSEIDRSILKALRVVGKALHISDLPQIDDETLRMTILQSYPPMIPVDREAQHKETIDQLREAGTSIETYLEEHGVQDVEEERARILQWQTDMANVDAEAKTKVALAQGEQRMQELEVRGEQQAEAQAERQEQQAQAQAQRGQDGARNQAIDQAQNERPRPARS